MTNNFKYRDQKIILQAKVAPCAKKIVWLHTLLHVHTQYVISHMFVVLLVCNKIACKIFSCHMRGPYLYHLSCNWFVPYVT